MSAHAKIPVRMTVEEFLLWDSGEERYELVDGEPRAMAPTRPVHGLLQGELGRAIGNHLRANRPACEVITEAPVIPRLLSRHNLRVPDLAVTCAPVRPDQAALPDPVLIIEILSPSNQAQTWDNVRAYTSIPSVQEILILRSDKVAAELWRRLADGEWPEEPAPVGDALDLQSIGLQLPMSDLYARTGLAG